MPAEKKSSLGASVGGSKNKSQVRSKVSKKAARPHGMAGPRGPVHRPQEQVASWDRSSITDEVSLAKVEELDGLLRELAEEIGFPEHYRTINDLDHGIEELAQRVASLRDRGYRYKNFLENKVNVIQAKWGQAEPNVRSELEAAERDLSAQYDETVNEFNLVSRMGSRGAGRLNALSSEVERLKTRLSSTEDVLRSTYANIHQTFNQTQSQIAQVEYLVDALDQAVFDILAGESAVQAVAAKYWRDGKNKGPDGVLYLTDQRLLFEQKEEVATKKVLFVATEKETVQDLLIEASVADIDSVKASSKGLMGNQDHLDFQLSGSATVPIAHFHIKGQDSELWAVLVNKVSSGEILNERWAAEGAEHDVVAAAEAAMTAAPEKCSACGAPLPLLTATQRQAECEYCGNAMRW